MSCDFIFPYIEPSILRTPPAKTTLPHLTPSISRDNPPMNKLTILLLALTTSTAFACGPELQSHPAECKLSDDYQSVKDQLQKNFDVDAENTVAYRALRLIDQDEYDKRKREVNFMPWKVYAPAPSTWILWEKGAARVDEMAADANLKPLTLEDIEDLNKLLISKDMMTSLAKLKGNTPGRIRTWINFVPPGTEFKCEENPMSDEDYNLMSNYDLKDFEGKPLIGTRFFKKCKTGRGYGGVITFMASSKVKKELQRWLDHYNSNLQKYLAGDQMDVSPLEFIIDAQRWFIAIHPFGDGNGRTARFLQDLFLKKLDLPFMPTGRISMLATRNEYQQRSKKEIETSVKYLNSCLSEYQKRQADSRRFISGHCLPMYGEGDTGERSELKNERAAFEKYLKAELAKALQDRS